MGNDDNQTKCGANFEHPWHLFRAKDGVTACDGILWKNKKDREKK